VQNHIENNGQEKTMAISKSPIGIGKNYSCILKTKHIKLDGIQQGQKSNGARKKLKDIVITSF